MTNEAGARDKKPYAAPTLTAYGDARTVTQSLLIGIAFDVPLPLTSIFHHST